MYKPKEIKNMEFAIYHKTGEYMDLYKLNFDELNEFFSNCDKYRSVLEEIKDIVEPIYEQIPDDKVLRQILLKISEVLNED